MPARACVPIREYNSYLVEKQVPLDCRKGGAAVAFLGLTTSRIARPHSGLSPSTRQPGFAMTSRRGLHLQTARLLVFTLPGVLLMIAPAPAQSPLPSEEMLREVCDEINSTSGSTATSAPPMSLPDAPVPQRAEVKVNVKVSMSK